MTSPNMTSLNMTSLPSISPIASSVSNSSGSFSSTSPFPKKQQQQLLRTDSCDTLGIPHSAAQRLPLFSQESLKDSSIDWPYTMAPFQPYTMAPFQLQHSSSRPSPPSSYTSPLPHTSPPPHNPALNPLDADLSGHCAKCLISLREAPVKRAVKSPTGNMLLSFCGRSCSEALTITNQCNLCRLCILDHPSQRVGGLVLRFSEIDCSVYCSYDEPNLTTGSSTPRDASCWDTIMTVYKILKNCPNALPIAKSWIDLENTQDSVLSQSLV